MRIGELATATGRTTKTLRFYERQGLVPASAREPNGYRSYDDHAVARLDFISRARAAGLTLAQIKAILDIRDAGGEPCMRVAQELAQRLRDIDSAIARLISQRATVAALNDAATSSGAEGRCQSERVCSYV